MSEDKPNGDGRFLFGFFIGGLIGALIIFFLGTKEGRRAGKVLEKKGKALLDDVAERVNDLEERGQELVERGEELKNEVLEKIEQKKEDLTEEAVERIDTALAHIEALQERGRQTTETLRKQFKNLPKKA